MEGDNSFSLHNDVNFDLELEQQCKKYLGETQWKYFRMQTKSLGNSYLFASSYFLAREIDYSNVSEYDSDFSLLLADFVYDLPKSLRVNFSTLMSRLKEYMLPQTSQEVPPFSLKIPCSLASLRRTYLDGSSSMYSKLPVPNVSMPKSKVLKYSYLTLLDCVTNFFAFGHGVKEVIAEDLIGEFDGSTAISNLCETRIANEKRSDF